MNRLPPAEIQRIRSEVAAKVRTLPALPAMCRQILAVINNPNVNFDTLAKQCAYDPGMTANVLRIANSAYYRAAQEIGSLRDAFVRIGARRLFGSENWSMSANCCRNNGSTRARPWEQRRNAPIN